ncbi:hypothetical protein WJX84_009964 [Apatococcus fuscideae]|uniref:Hint domain-containing protein n=1 Tax=Apatococcus fuscideae TaxID=2026836 RepID=A0AAW1TG13_9CHLO
MDGSGFQYQLSYRTGYVVNFGLGYSPVTHYTCTDVPRTRFASCPTASSSLQITCTNLVYSCHIKYDISIYTDYSQCESAPPPPQRSSSSSSSSSGCQCSCCLGTQCTMSFVGTAAGVTDTPSCTPDSCRTAYRSSCPAVGADGVVSSSYVASYSETSGSGTPSGKCFPASAVVQTPQGTRTMDGLRVGDKVLVNGHNGQAHYEEIFMFSHRNAKQSSEFLVLRAANNMSLTISPGHYLFLNQGRDLLRAADAKLGDYIWTLPESQPGGSSVLTPTKVVDIQPSMQQGKGMDRVLVKQTASAADVKQTVAIFHEDHKQRTLHGLQKIVRKGKTSLIVFNDANLAQACRVLPDRESTDNEKLDSLRRLSNTDLMQSPQVGKRLRPLKHHRNQDVAAVASG